MRQQASAEAAVKSEGGRLLPAASDRFCDRYALDRLLGKGSFGEVWVCRPSASTATEKECGDQGARHGFQAGAPGRKGGDKPRELACKIFDKRRIASDAERKQVQKEVALLLAFRGQHQGVVQVEEVFESADAVHVVMELCEGGDLFDLLKTRGRLPEPAARLVFRQLASALEACHARGVIHRDIKPENILFRGNTDFLYLMSPVTDFNAPVHAKLADFGLAASVQPGQTTDEYTGSRFYVAPEMILGKAYGRRADVWSLGVVLCAMLTGRLPFSGRHKGDDEGLLRAILRGKVCFASPSWAGVSETAKDLVRRMLEVEPQTRVRARDLLLHPWCSNPKPWAAPCPSPSPASPALTLALASRGLRHSKSITSSSSSTLSLSSGLGSGAGTPRSADTIPLKALATDTAGAPGGGGGVEGASSKEVEVEVEDPCFAGGAQAGQQTPKSEESFRVRARARREQHSAEEGFVQRTSSLLGNLGLQGRKLLSTLQGRRSAHKKGMAVAGKAAGAEVPPRLPDVPAPTCSSRTAEEAGAGISLAETQRQGGRTLPEHLLCMNGGASLETPKLRAQVPPCWTAEEGCSHSLISPEALSSRGLPRALTTALPQRKCLPSAPPVAEGGSLLETEGLSATAMISVGFH